MEKNSIYEKLKELKTNWNDYVNKKADLKEQEEIENQKEVREFVGENKKYLTILKNQYPEEFEQYYWDILVCVKRNNIFQNTVYDKMLPITALVVSCTSVVKGDIASIFAHIVCAVAIVVFYKYIRSAMNTREPSYYEIMLALLEDLRNGEEA